MLSAAQLKQRQLAGKSRAKAFTSAYQRQAGLALKQRVNAAYYQKIGRMGGRRSLYNWFIYQSRHYELRQDKPDLIVEWQARWGPQVAARLVEQWNALKREDFVELAERYRDEIGTRVMLVLFRPEPESVLEQSAHDRLKNKKGQAGAAATCCKHKHKGKLKDKGGLSQNGKIPGSLALPPLPLTGSSVTAAGVRS
jgi:hypothetical protein